MLGAERPIPWKVGKENGNEDDARLSPRLIHSQLPILLSFPKDKEIGKEQKDSKRDVPNSINKRDP